MTLKVSEIMSPEKLDESLQGVSKFVIKSKGILIESDETGLQEF